MTSNLLALIQADYERLAQTIAPLTDDQMMQPGAIGESSVKDVLAHLAAWERRLCQRVRGRPEDGADLKTPDYNALIHQQNKDRSLKEVRTEFKRSHTQVLKLAASLTDAEQTLWAQAFKFNSYNHYKWAYTHIRRWIRTQLAPRISRQ